MRTLFLALLFTGLISQAQTVENIKTSQVGDKIHVTYNIENSQASQLLTVSISCLVNNDKRIELTNVTGDVGKDVKGGQASYTIIWDVLKDVNELKSAEFFIKIKVQNPAIATVSMMGTNSSHPYYIAYYGGLSYTPFGLRFGYQNNWGYFGALRFGEGYYDDGVDFNLTTLYSVTAGVSKRLYQKGDVKLSASLGLGYAYWGDYTYTSVDSQNPNITYQASGDDDEALELDLGGSLDYKQFKFMVGLGMTMGGLESNGDILIGLGYGF